MSIDIQVGDDLKLTREVCIKGYTKDEVECILKSTNLNLIANIHSNKNVIVANYNGNSNYYYFHVIEIIEGYYILKRTSVTLGDWYTIIKESDMYNYISNSTFEIDIKKRRLKNLKVLLKD